MSTKHSFKIPYIWQFVDEKIDGVGVCAVIAASEGEAESRNLAIKVRDGRSFFAITLYRESWSFSEDEEVFVKINFFGDKPETIAGCGNGKILDITLPMSSAPLFLFLLATSEAMELSLPGRNEDPWLFNLMFAEPIVRKMIRRLMVSSD